MLTRLLLVCIAATAWRSAACDEAPGERILGEEALRSALADHTFYGRYEGGIDWIEYYSPDGRSAYWDGCTHDGSWWISDDLVCFQYNGDISGAQYCWKFYKVGDGYQFVTADGASGPSVRAYTTAIAKGNSQHLPLDTDDCVSVRLQLDDVRVR